MFKWFAPLLLFVGKPEMVIRIVTLAIAGVVLFFGVYLLSNIALTLDALKSPTIIAAYGALLFCFFVGVGTVAWLRLRRLGSPPQQTALPRQVVEAPPLADDIVSRRAERMSRAWQRIERRPAEPARAEPRTSSAAAPRIAPMPASPVRATLLVTGPAYTGKTALIVVLSRGADAGAPDAGGRIGLADGGSCEGDQALDDLLQRAASCGGVLFVVDQDLRAPEVAAITRFIATGKPLYLVLNKSDQFSAADRDAILLSIRAKMPKLPPGNVVAAAAAPSPVEREIEDARGAVRVDLRRPSRDVVALTTLLRRAFPSTDGQPLRFEAT